MATPKRRETVTVMAIAVDEDDRLCSQCVARGAVPKDLEALGIALSESVSSRSFKNEAHSHVGRAVLCPLVQTSKGQIGGIVSTEPRQPDLLRTATEQSHPYILPSKV